MEFNKIYILYALIAFVMFLLVIYIINILVIISKINNNDFKEYTHLRSRKKSDIPNVIYTYLNNKTPSPLERKCIRSWRRHNPTYKIIIINKDNISTYISDINLVSLKNVTDKNVSDFIRLYILANNGGIWLDSNVYLNSPLGWIHAYQQTNKSEFVGYKVDRYTSDKIIVKIQVPTDESTNTMDMVIPVIDTFLLACVPGSKFMNDWRQMLFLITNYESSEEYVNEIQKTTVFQNIKNPSDNIILLACQYILQHVNGPQISPENYIDDGTKNYKLDLLVAEKSPYLYLDKMNWFVSNFIFVFLYFKGSEAPVIKYREIEQKIIDSNYLYNLLD